MVQVYWLQFQLFPYLLPDPGNEIPFNSMHIRIRLVQSTEVNLVSVGIL